MFIVHVSVITVSGLPPMYVLDFPNTSSFGFLKKLAIQSLFAQIFCRYVRFKDLLIEKSRNFKGNQVISSCNLKNNYYPLHQDYLLSAK